MASVALPDDRADRPLVKAVENLGNVARKAARELEGLRLEQRKPPAEDYFKTIGAQAIRRL